MWCFLGNRFHDTDSRGSGLKSIKWPLINSASVDKRCFAFSFSDWAFDLCVRTLMIKTGCLSLLSRYLRQLLCLNLLEMPKLYVTIIPVALGNMLRSSWRSECDTSRLVSLTLKYSFYRLFLLFVNKTTTNPVPVAVVLLFLHSGVISGAITSQYLLEKSRIVFQVTHKIPKISHVILNIFFLLFLLTWPA